MSDAGTVRIATRGSDLALAQARAIATRVEGELGLVTELVVITTSGDRIQDRSLADLGGKGLFVKEIEEALLEGNADLAVHSAKDLPGELAPGLRIAVHPEREDPRDALVVRDGPSGRSQSSRVPGARRLDDLRPGARVGTGSARRAAQLARLRPDLEIVPLRGNVPTRLRKLEDEGLDAVVLAAAGLARLGLADRIAERLDPARFVPAVCQGTLALETRADDSLAEVLATLGNAEAERSAACERAFLRRLGGDCHVPLAGYARTRADGSLHLTGLVATPDGASAVRDEATSPRQFGADDDAPHARDLARRPASDELADAEALGTSLADALLAQGGGEILAASDGAAPSRAPGGGPEGAAE